jgi:serine/threonine protein kinase
MTDASLLNTKINNYELLEQLGQGGVGDVYLAQHPEIGKRVAVKVLRKDVEVTPEVEARFFHEAKVVNQIAHENIIDVLDFGKTSAGLCYIIMEYLEGDSLVSALEFEAPFSVQRLGHIGLQLCAALYATHQCGVVHRDVKSNNVHLVTRSGVDDFVKLLDFGIAKVPHGILLNTASGQMLGTPLYMSPEQALGKLVNEQTDIYALGVLLYQMATGSYPFYDENPVTIANMHVNTPVPLPRSRRPEISEALEAIILGCLEKEKSKRYQSTMEVATLLSKACGLPLENYFGKKPLGVIENLVALPAPKRSWGLIGAASVGAFVVATAIFYQAKTTQAPNSISPAPIAINAVATQPLVLASQPSAQPIQPTPASQPTTPIIKKPDIKTSKATKDPKEKPIEKIQKEPNKEPKKNIKNSTIDPFEDP